MYSTTLSDEFEFLNENDDTSTYEEDSESLVNEAKSFINKSHKFSNVTYQGISVLSICESITLGNSSIMPWNHVKFTIDVNKLKDLNNDRIIELYIPSFVEELESIGDKAETEFGYNQAYRNNLKEVFIPKNIVVIADNTFAFYKKLEKISFEKDCKLMYLGEQAFACCEKLQMVDLQNCIYLDEIRNNTFANSAVKVLKINSTIQSICSLENTNIETVFIDSDKYDIKTFNRLIKESNGVFWGQLGYNF